MKFDIIVGNPPYNNDEYIPFAFLAKNIAKQCSCLITPARWQAKGGEENERFRQEVLPYIEDVVYYIDCGDIFNIRMKGGVAYYTILNTVINNKNIANKCERVSLLSESTVKRELDKDVFLGNTLSYSICKKVGCFSDNFKNFEPKWQAYEHNYNAFIATVNADAGGKTSFHIFSNDGNMTVIAPINVEESTTFMTPDIKCIFSSASIDEVNSFISWINTKLIRFLILMRTCSYHNDNKFTWKFVPEEQAYDHIFSDDELYNRYAINDEEKKLIETIIKNK